MRKIYLFSHSYSVSINNCVSLKVYGWKTKLQALIFGGEDGLPAILARHQIPGLDVVVDPCAAILVFIVTGLLCMGIKEVQALYDFDLDISINFNSVRIVFSYMEILLCRAHLLREL